MASKRDVLETVREDDYVEYFLFPPETEGTTDKRQSLIDLLSVANDKISKASENYLWQKDELALIPRNISSLPPVVDNEEHLPPHLYGVTHYGENIEDEWFIVYVLIQLTKDVPGLIARVVDVDGEFLLIEAADHLPHWASPEVCSKRVYIYNGDIHIVPPTKQNEQISVEEGLAYVRQRSEETRASAGIQAAIRSRVNGYPEKAVELLHQTVAFVPARVAALLRVKPSLIAPAVTAFCHRDPIDLRACRAMRHFPPETRVMTTVKMTRCLYAMLSQAKFTPDRRTGWQLPLRTSSDYQAHYLGIKIACGFEILVSQSKSKDDLETDRGWHRYKQSLKDKGYFKELLDGSKEYCRLEKEAAEFYRSHMCYSQPSLGNTVVSLLEEVEVDEESMKRAEANLPPPDDDSWMTISSDDLEKIMTERYGARPQTSDIPGGLAAFLTQISGLEGAEHPSPNSATTSSEVPLRPPRTKKKTQEEQRDDENNRISFDQEAFSCALQNILDFSVPEDSWDLDSDESGMSSYEDEAEMDLSRKRSDNREGSDSEMKQYMDQMDRELQSTSLGQSFIKKQNKGMEDSFSDIESFEPVDIDMNALKNILASYEAQIGGPGPASNMLGPMGLNLDRK